MKTLRRKEENGGPLWHSNRKNLRPGEKKKPQYANERVGENDGYPAPSFPLEIPHFLTALSAHTQTGKGGGL